MKGIPELGRSPQLHSGLMRVSTPVLLIPYPDVCVRRSLTNGEKRTVLSTR